MSAGSRAEIIKVRVEELDTKMRSKEDVDMVLRQCCIGQIPNIGQFYLPGKAFTSLRYLRAIL